MSFLRKVRLERFRRFGDAEIELAPRCFLLGPTGSGKTTIAQALELWHRLSARGAPSAMAHTDADLAWLQVRSMADLWQNNDTARPIRIEVEVDGEAAAAVEIQHVGPERWSVTCSGGSAAAGAVELVCVSAFDGARDGPSLRDRCLSLATAHPDRWDVVRREMRDLLAVDIAAPRLDSRGSVEVTGRTPSGAAVDVAHWGSGANELLWLLLHVASHPRGVLFVDDAMPRLDRRRQHAVLRLLDEAASGFRGQLILAGSSEEMLARAEGRDHVVSIAGKPRLLAFPPVQARKPPLVNFDDHYHAAQAGWLLYLEGETDLAILRALASRCAHPSAAALKAPAVRYFANQPRKARGHFRALVEANPELVGLALFDPSSAAAQPRWEEVVPGLVEYRWRRREIENYICSPAVLIAYAAGTAAGCQEALRDGSLEPSIRAHRIKVMEDCLATIVPADARDDDEHPFWIQTKASEAFLERLFSRFFDRLELPHLIWKARFHELVRHLAPECVHPEVLSVLDRIHGLAGRTLVMTPGSAG